MGQVSFYRIVIATLNSILICVLLYPLYLWAPYLEGGKFPVTERMQVSEMEEVGVTRIRIWGEIKKLRECDFRTLHPNVGRPSGPSSQVLYRFEETTKARDAGPFAFGPWLLDMDRDAFENLSFIHVYHRCYWRAFGLRVPRPWLTRTVLHETGEG